MDKFDEDLNWRRAERFNAQANIKVTAGKDVFIGKLRDISLKGISFLCMDNINTEEACRFEITFSDGARIKAKGAFMWNVPKGRDHLYGVDFTKLGFFSRRRLQKWLKHRAKIILAPGLE